MGLFDIILGDDREEDEDRAWERYEETYDGDGKKKKKRGWFF